MINVRFTIDGPQPGPVDRGRLADAARLEDATHGYTRHPHGLTGITVLTVRTAFDTPHLSAALTSAELIARRIPGGIRAALLWDDIETSPGEWDGVPVDLRP